MIRLKSKGNSNNIEYKKETIDDYIIPAHTGFLPVLAAIAGNFIIAIMKFIGFSISGSATLFSEAIHSLADTFNQVLLMVGIRSSLREGDSEFAYGYGKERFLWALISACGIFFVGAGVTVYHGITSLTHHEEVYIGPAVFIILAVSFVIEAITFWIAIRELRRVNKGLSFADSLKKGDPVTIAVIYEDGIATVGVLIAFFSTLMYSLTKNHYWDAAGSIVIGLILGLMAIILISKNRQFLIEKAIPDEDRERIIEILEADPSIEKVIDFKSSILDIGKYRIKCEVEFNGSALLRKLYKKGELKEEYETVRNDYNEFIKFCAEYIDRAPRLIGERIDDIERRIKKEVPEIKHIDIEIN